MKRRFRAAGLFCLSIVLITDLSGCVQGKTPAEKAFQYIEKAAELESGFNGEQEPLVKQEQVEQSLYKDIMSLNVKQFDEIKKKSEEALNSVNKREKLIANEKKSIDLAKDEFDKALPYLKQIKDPTTKTISNSVVTDMNDRYKDFQNLYTAYNSSVSEDQKLFEMLETKNITEEHLQAQLVKVNAAYKRINQFKESFNANTTKFNLDKKGFYKSMNISGKHSG